MAQPSVRAKAMADKDQGQVWAEVRKQQESMAVEVEGGSTSAAPAAAPPSAPLRTTSSYAVVMENKDVKEKVDAIAKPIEQNYQSLIQQLRDRKAVGAVVVRAKSTEVSLPQAQAFLADMEGRWQTIESEPGVFRQTEVSGDGFKAFALTSLLPKTGFEVHVAKMAD